MKLEVPFYPQTNETNCGPAALRMILSYFGKDYRLSEIEREAGIEAGKGLYTLQLALAARRLGLSVRFFTRSLGFNSEHLKMDFYQKYSPMNESRMALLMQDARTAGILMKECSLTLEEILSYVHRDSLVLVLLDWNSTLKKEGYQGHFVPLVGYDDEFVYVHNPGPQNAQAFVPLTRTIFDEARKARGTDEDLAIISR